LVKDPAVTGIRVTCAAELGSRPVIHAVVFIAILVLGGSRCRSAETFRRLRTPSVRYRAVQGQVEDVEGRVTRVIENQLRSSITSTTSQGTRKGVGDSACSNAGTDLERRVDIRTGQRVARYMTDESKSPSYTN
jgi:hypothetical protein